MAYKTPGRVCNRMIRLAVAYTGPFRVHFNPPRIKVSHESGAALERNKKLTVFRFKFAAFSPRRPTKTYGRAGRLIEPKSQRFLTRRFDFVPVNFGGLRVFYTS